MFTLLRIGRVACFGLASWLVWSVPTGAGPLGGIVGLPGQVLGGVGQTASQIGPGLGTTVRAVARDVVGRPVMPRTFDHDALGNRVQRGLVIVVSPTERDLAAARQLNFDVARSDELPSLGLSVVVLRVPSDASTIDAIAELRRADPTGNFEYEHIYDPSTSALSPGLGQETPTAASLDSRSARIGMIDGGISRHHPSLDDASLTLKNLASSGDGPATEHGTAIASLLVGNDDDFQGCLVGARLFAADVYGGQTDGGGALEIAHALDWLSANHVGVVNISLTGPANRLLELAVERFLARGGVIVAAVGNAGPAAPGAYPASYSGVVGVTAVDIGRHVELDATRAGAMFAALGVNVRAAKIDHGYANYTGTSFAAPIVAARFALLLGAPDPVAAHRSLEILRREAVPIAAHQTPSVFGYLAFPLK